MTVHGCAADYLDGEMTPEEEEAFIAHLVECAACGAELADEIQLRDREQALSSGRRHLRFISHLTRGRRGLALGSGTSLLAMAAVVIALLPGDRAVPRAAVHAGIRVEIEASAGTRRGRTAHPGDRLRASAGAAADVFELRIYRADRELLRCPGAAAPSCREMEKSVEVSCPLTAPGEYQVVWFESSNRLPPATGDREADTRAVRVSGGRVAAFETIHVY